MAAARSLSLWWVWVGLGTCHQGLQFVEQEPRHLPPPGAGRVKTLGITDAVWDSRGCGEASARSL